MSHRGFLLGGGGAPGERWFALGTGSHGTTAPAPTGLVSSSAHAPARMSRAVMSFAAGWAAYGLLGGPCCAPICSYATANRCCHVT
ncbi:hypothetical protein, partial [Streptomyces mirabilis]|uniref:hypothetical protein n=1 Tax=Streptomyces mirabilis TaxID=68239 RepID=UPI0036DB775E